jgi:hypothetical protein
MSVLVTPSNPSHWRIIANDGMRRPFRRGLTRADVLVVLAVGLILVVVFLAIPRGHPAELSRRPVCATNLSSIGKGLYTYASDNNEVFPIAAHAPTEADEVGRVKYAPGMIGTHRGKPGDPKAGETTENDTEMSTTRSLWVLITGGGASPRSFICPSSASDQPDDEDNPLDYRDFRGWKEISYGYQIPYGKHGRPSGECDPRMALAADKGPYGAAMENKARNPGVPKPGIASSEDDWSPWNSPNHGGEGQNVLFGDSHVEFVFTPIRGVKNDNIYTRWSDASGGSDANPGPRTHGTPPTGIETPWSDTDSFIYP